MGTHDGTRTTRQIRQRHTRLCAQPRRCCRRCPGSIWRSRSQRTRLCKRRLGVPRGNLSVPERRMLQPLVSSLQQARAPCVCASHHRRCIFDRTRLRRALHQINRHAPAIGEIVWPQQRLFCEHRRQLQKLVASLTFGVEVPRMVNQAPLVDELVAFGTCATHGSGEARLARRWSRADFDRTERMSRGRWQMRRGSPSAIRDANLATVSDIVHAYW